MGRRTDVDPADAAKVIALICVEIDKAREWITSEASWSYLVEFFFEKLALRNAIWAEQITAWAIAGHPAADRAARRYAFEMEEHGLEDTLLLQVKAYANRAKLHPFVPFPRGRHVVQNLTRDLWIHVVAQRVADGTGLLMTRGASTTTPCVAWFIHRAMKRRGFRISEREVTRILGNRNQVVGALEASMPQRVSAV
jgi:hypothetical protein